jgi:uncharacterized protein
MRACLSRLLGLVALLLPQHQAQANDSAAHLGAGGLEFTTTDAVVMEKEDLYLSPELVKVDYVFRNITSSPVELRVAFPLPRLDMRIVHGCSEVGIPYPDDKNFIRFTTQANGKSVRMEMQEKAFAGDTEITPLLKDMNVPIAELSGTLRERLNSLSPADQRRLSEAGAIGEQEYCNDGPQPVWNAEVIYHWQQRFEPGAATRISHSYSPVVGSFFISPDAKLFGPPDKMSPRDPNLTHFCVDEGTWRAIRKRAPNGDLVIGRNLEYILQTARSWKGPIRDFTLTIDKQDPQGIVSLCASGIKKIGPTTFQIKKRDFRPDDDLNVLFVDVDQSPNPPAVQLSKAYHNTFKQAAPNNEHPSFDCARAARADEIAICQDPKLAQLENLVAKLAIQYVPKKDRQQNLKLRGNCGSNRLCIANRLDNMGQTANCGTEANGNYACDNKRYTTAPWLDEYRIELIGAGSLSNYFQKNPDFCVGIPRVTVTSQDGDTRRKAGTEIDVVSLDKSNGETFVSEYRGFSYPAKDIVLRGSCKF